MKSKKEILKSECDELVTISEKSSDEELQAASFEIETINEPEIFGRLNGAGNVDLLHRETGERVTRYDGCWPLNSELSGSWEHPEGIELSKPHAEALKIPIEGIGC